MTAAAAAEHDAERLERLDRQPVARAVRAVLGKVRGDRAGAGDVLRVAGVVRGGLALDAWVRGPVDVLGGRVQGGEPAGDQDGFEPFGGRRQIADGTESAEGLTEDRPGRPSRELRTDQFAVADDAVGAEVREVVGLLARAAAQRQGLPGGRGGEPGPALVQEQYAELPYRPAQPGLRTDETACAEAGAALQVDQPGQLLGRLPGCHGFAGEELDRLAARVVVVEGNREPAVREDESGLAVAAQGNSCIGCFADSSAHRGARTDGRSRCHIIGVCH